MLIMLVDATKFLGKYAKSSSLQRRYIEANGLDFMADYMY